jgi:hypothetical protein
MSSCWLRRGTIVTLLALLVSGCATPPEVKTASRAQLELVDALDKAVADLQRGIDRFHDAKLRKTKEEGRILIARQAIDVAAGDPRNPPQVSADQLFLKFEADVAPWIDYAFTSETVEKSIAEHRAKIARIDKSLQGSDLDESKRQSLAVLKNSLTNDLDDLRLLEARLTNKPPDVVEIEKVIEDDLQRERKSQDRVSLLLTVLREQIANMRAMAARVDSWLAIDVTVDQEQVDALEKAYREASAALDKGGAE